MTPNRLRRIVPLLLLMAGLILSGCDGKSSPPPESSTASVSGDTSAPATEALVWETDLDKARQLATQTNRLVFVNFTGSDWCGWCMRLHDEVFSQPRFISFFKAHFIPVKLDFPRGYKLPPEQEALNSKLAQTFRVQGFPTIVILDKSGRELARTGYQEGGPEAYITHLKQLVTLPGQP